MSIPLDRLYNYIEISSNEIYGDPVLIYRFWPHGSKNINNLIPTRLVNQWFTHVLAPDIYCNDQEPLNWKYYQEQKRTPIPAFHQLLKEQGIEWEMLNFRNWFINIWDQALLIHSEKNSKDVELYKQSRFIPVYYWSHAIIARDWFRYAAHIKITKKDYRKKFLIYNRAWSGTREYRLKFSDLLISKNLLEYCKTWTNVVEPVTKIHYQDHKFNEPEWKPINLLDNFFQPTDAGADCSADFEVENYEDTDFEVVLETLFSEEKIQLTEKILRPIALGHPFILVSTPGSLEYLKSYGFKTFDCVFDEKYDTILDHSDRLNAVVDVMSTISKWTDQQQISNMEKIKHITDHNRKHFFSDNFFKLIDNELKTNLLTAFDELKQTNTSRYFINYRKQIFSNSVLRNYFESVRTEKESALVFEKANNYYTRSLKLQ